LGTRTPSRRETGSLNLRTARAVDWLVRAGWNTPFGPPGPSAQSLELTSDGAGLQAGREEFADGQRFFRHFHGALKPSDLAGKKLLDVGCGYGGRTVFYEKQCDAAAVFGVEPHEAMVQRCRMLADELSASASFDVGFAERLPYPDDEFDVVVSFDVLEHCEDPRLAVREMVRVLRPGGRCFNVFPTYRGARSHHLGYVTGVPAIHRIFHPDTLIEVMNDAIEREPDRVGIRRQPDPAWSSLGHYTLPHLNGFTLREAKRVLATTPGLTTERIIITPLVDPQLTRREIAAALGSNVLAAAVAGVAHLLAAWQRVLPLPELLIQNIAVIARKDA
jgi:ubiquinone/menaquinone biosynthesis C-methylase UbiE